ncbi:MAG: BamA/TamA family outer membrane protein, partial [Bacteroidaceae bacterium]
NRASFFNMVSFGLGWTYKWNKNSTSKNEFTPFGLTFDRLLSSTSEFQEIMNNNPALYISMRDQFVPSMHYTYTFSSPKRRRNPIWWQTSIKEAGNLTAALYSLSGKKFSEKNKTMFHNPFAQFLKITTELHTTFKISNEIRLATRLMGGLIYSYGNSNVAPYNEQFYVGGANSVRGFTIRNIGPGRFHTDQSKYSYMDQTGDLKLEANAELRFPIFGSLRGAVFVDAGNVWLLRKDEQRPNGQFKLSTFAESIALSTGAGLRYDLDFLVLRLDLGIALHDPSNTEKSGYYNIPSFTEGMSLHFAIGYPF